MLFRSCGVKEFGNPSPLHTKPKAHVEEEEMSEDEQREPKLPGYTVKDDPVLDRPKSQKGKNATSPEAVPSSIPKEVPNPMGQP